MPILVKNAKLKNQIYRKMNQLENKALKLYDVGKIKEGRKFEDRSDKLYKDNYYKMFRIKRL